MTTDLRGYELDMYEWLKKHAPQDAVTFARILADHAEPHAMSPAFVASVLDALPPDMSADARPIDFFPGFRNGVLGEMDDRIRDLPRGELAELVRLTALRYACQLYKGDDRLGRNLLFFNAFSRVYNEVHSDGAVRRREVCAEDGWHGRYCVIYPDDKNPQALLNAYKQGQKAKRDGRACGCYRCEAEAAAEAAARALPTYEATVGDPEPAFPTSDDDDTPF